MAKNIKLTEGYTPEYVPPPMPEVVQPKVVYLCDRQACERAQTHGCNTEHYCKHTSKIEHAINFTQLADNVYEERSFMTVKRLLDFAPNVMWCRFEDGKGYTFDLHRNHDFMRTIEDMEVAEIGCTNGGSLYVKLSEAIR